METNDQSTQAPSTIATLQPSQPSDKSSSPGVSTGLMLWMCLLTAITTLMIGYFTIQQFKPLLLGAPAGQGSEIVFVDLERIITAKLQENLKNPKLSAQNADAEALAFKAQIDASIVDLAKTGKVVLYKQAVISGGEHMDATLQIMRQLGL